MANEFRAKNGVLSPYAGVVYIDLDTTTATTPAKARLWYNTEDDTLNVGHDNDVVQQIGQEFFMPPCKNTSGVTIPNGAFVMATGAQGDKITIAKAVTNGSVAPEYMIGVATRAISVDDEFAQIVTNGIVRDINTSAWVVGTILYPDPAAPGGFTGTKPHAPNIKTPVAIVLRQHASTGRIYVRMTNGSVLGGTDSNVEFGTLAANDLIVYNATNSRWENVQPSSVPGLSGHSGYSGISGFSGTSGFSGISGYSGVSGYSGYTPLGALNWNQTQASQITVPLGGPFPYTIASVTITTNGNPVQIIASGDANPQGPGGWGTIQLYRGTTSIAGGVNFESSSANENNPYCLQFIDTPSAGTYTYNLKVNLLAGYDTQFGESSGPIISVVELQNVEGKSGYSGSGVSGYSGFSGISGAAGPQGTSGISGYSGATGTSGFSGYSGTSGFSGISGYSGISGFSGISGYSGSLPSWLLKTSNYTANDNDRIIADTSGGSFTITLPASPSAGAYVVITDGADWNTNSLAIARNGSTIEGYSDDLLVTLKGVTVELIYSGSSWQVTATTGTAGASGYSGYSGFSGESGTSGYSGYSGFSGESGTSGYSGSGISGYSGFSGYSGTSGSNGDSGFSGHSGISGYSGYSGISGYSGTNGSNGASGISGYSGFSGISGYSGFSGFSGYSGATGAAGGFTTNSDATIKSLRFYGVGGDSGNGSVFDSYAIYQQGGSWTHPYPDLCIGYHTGIKIGAHFSYSGTRFYNNSDWATEIFSVGDGDNNVRVQSDIRSPIYYDLNNTGYYVDPNSGSYLNVVGAAGRFYTGFDSGAANSISCSNWFRTNGSTGWYNESYGGGIYMEDSTWVRVYNSKALYVANNIAATGNVYAYYSDERLKTKICNIDNALDKVLSLNGFYYTNNKIASQYGYNDRRVQVGLSAQEVEKVLPEVISIAPFDMQTSELTGEITSKSGNNYKTVDYSGIVPLLVEAIKQQQTQIDYLKTLISE